jgi:hypothetical protein
VLVWLTLAMIWGSTWLFIKLGLEDRKPQPNSLIERREFEYIATIIEPTSRTTTSALKNRRPRNTASPVLPVGDRERRQFQERARAPNPSAGDGIPGCGFAILKSGA